MFVKKILFSLQSINTSIDESACLYYSIVKNKTSQLSIDITVVW